MPSSHTSSSSTGKESYFTAEEDNHTSAQAPNVAELIGTATRTGSSESLYATAHQTPVASPDISRGIATSLPDTAQFQNAIEPLGRVEESPEEYRERDPSIVTTAPGGSSFTHKAEASGYLEMQRALVMQQTEMRKPQIEMVEYGISVPMPVVEEDAPDSPTALALDEFSRLWPPPSAPCVNDGRPTSLADTFDEKNYTERRDEASDVSYPYRPAPIDSDPQQQRQQNFLPTSLPFNNTFPLESHRNTDAQQGLASIGENETPHGYPSMKFVMNPEAPVFVPGMAGQPAMKAGDPRDGVYHGLPQQKPSQVPAAPTDAPNIANPLAKVPLFGSGHGMFFDPSTGMFTGDGAPRKSPYRADGTLPSKPDLQSDFIAKEQYPEPAEDKLHIQSEREVSKRMANFGKNGPIQRFRLGRPVPQGNQQGTRVMVEKGAEGGLPLGRRMPTADEEEIVSGRRMPTADEAEMVPGRRMPTADEAEMVPGRRMPTADEAEIVPGRRLYTAEETAAGLARLTARTGKGKEAPGVKEKDFGAQEGDVEEKKKEEDEDEEKKKQFGGVYIRDFAVRKGKGRYAGSF